MFLFLSISINHRKLLAKMWNLILLYVKILSSDENFIRFCQDKGLVRGTFQCPHCPHELLEPYRGENSNGFFGFFRCQKKCHGRHGSFKQSVAKGTWFENSRLDPKKNLILVYCFAAQMTYDNIIRECHFEEFDSDLSTETICDWSNFIRYFFIIIMCVLFVLYSILIIRNGQIIGKFAWSGSTKSLNSKVR